MVAQAMEPAWQIDRKEEVWVWRRCHNEIQCMHE